MSTRWRFRGALVFAIVTWAALSAAEFSKSISADDFAAAGLSKLTPEELARLDALIQGQRTTEVARVQAETTKQVKAEIAAQPAANASAGAHQGSLLKRLRVVLTPGTDIEYEKVETELVGKFRGYSRGTVFTLSNGQQWRVIEGDYWSSAKDEDKVRKVVIEPGALGSFYLKIEGGGRPKVSFVGNAK